MPGQWANFQALRRLAKDRDTAGILSHVSTDNVARDMLRIVEAYGQTKLQYWGISYVHDFFIPCPSNLFLFRYGSVLGAAFATLFPVRWFPMQNRVSLTTLMS